MRGMRSMYWKGFEEHTVLEGPDLGSNYDKGGGPSKKGSGKLTDVRRLEV